MSDLPPDSTSAEAPQPMQPLAPSVRRQSSRRAPVYAPREPIQAFYESTAPMDEEIIATMLSPEREIPRAAHRQADPIVAYLLLVSLAIGVSPLEASLRYVILWSLMALLGAIAYFLGEVERLREAKLEDLVFGVLFGFFASFPFLLVFGAALKTVSARMFDVPDTPPLVMDTWVFLAAVFVIPLSESLFFRGGMQSVRSWFLTSLLGTLWSAVLFFPHMEMDGRWVIAGILMVVFALLNFLYSYVKVRNGLAGAWLCQVVSYSLLWFLPRLLF